MMDPILRMFFGEDRVFVGDAIPNLCPECGWGMPTSDGYCLNCTPPPDHDDDPWDYDDYPR